MVEAVGSLQSSRRFSPSVWRWWGMASMWALIAAVGCAAVVDWRIRTTRAETLHAVERRLQALGDNVENHFASLMTLGAVVVRQPHLHDFMAQRTEVPTSPARSLPSRQALQRALAGASDVQAMSAELATLVRDVQIAQAVMLDREGTVVADSALADRRTDALGMNVATRTYFTEAIAQGRGFQFVLTRLDRRPGFVTATRIGDGGTVQGVLALMTDPRRMARLFASGADFITLLVDQRGLVVASSQPALEQRRAPPSLAPRAQAASHGDAPSGMTDTSPLPWQHGTVSVAGRSVASLTIQGEPHLLLTRTLTGYPFAVWAAAPLGQERGMIAAGMLSFAGITVLGWLTLWLRWRRRERSEIEERVRRETLEMTRALPLTLFRYRVSPEGKGQFSHLGSGVREVFGVDASQLEREPERCWTLAGMTDGLPPTEPVEFAIDRDEQQHWISVNSAVATTPDGGRIYDGYWLDVTERHQAESRFEAAFQHAPTAYFFLHRERGILRCNPATLRLFGVGVAADVIGQRPWDTPLSPEMQPGGLSSVEMAGRILDRYRGDASPYQFSWRHRRADGSLLDCEITLVWLGHEDPDLYFAIDEDVTARRRTEEAMREASEAAQATSRAKSAFLANMSHEIRTPMNAIIGMTQLALQGGSVEQLRGYVGKAHQAANSLLQIINDILDVSKIEAGHLELEHIVFPVQEVLDQVADVLSLQAERKGLELLFDLPAQLPARLHGDPTRLRQILVNLGSNAVKFTDRGSVRIGLEVAQRHEHEVVLHGWVRDTGMGMTPEQQSRLFEPFMQADASSTRRFGGTGLGLTISRELSERMGGRIWVDSALHRGSTFHFTVRLGLPADPSPMAPVRDAWVGKRLLLVDDHPEVHEVLGQMARDLGLEVASAESGPEALRLLDASPTPYDWILIDWHMPEMDGVACAREALQHSRTRFPQREPCVLLVTAFNREDALAAARGVDLADVLIKPVSPSTLFDSLSRALRGPERPAGSGHPDTWKAVRLAAPQEAPADSPAAATPLAGLRILLAEDQLLNQELAREVLTRAGANVVIADHGEEALKMLEAEGPFDCVLMDCQMPVMDGYAATRHIRADARWVRLPVIAMTASALSTDREAALESGMNDHITKPLDVHQLYAVIQRWTRLSQRPSVTS